MWEESFFFPPSSRRFLLLFCFWRAEPSSLSRCWVDVNRTPDGFSFESWGGAEKDEPQAPPPPPHPFAVTQSASVHCPLTVCVFKSGPLSLLMTPLHQIPRAFILGLLLCSFLILPRRLVTHETRCGIQMWWCASVCTEVFVPQSFLFPNRHTHRLFVQRLCLSYRNDSLYKLVSCVCVCARVCACVYVSVSWWRVDRKCELRVTASVFLSAVCSQAASLQDVREAQQRTKSNFKGKAQKQSLF